ncbi:MAG: methyltransferase domain-containing protein [Sulfurimicrobium sp.]|nr:methyltransferase domain-containing protein [Sulfurimicrobium sp.]MDP2962151.1 methyltransferase domain-containing protein [Sulfurimicrobium sp.]MDZ7654303.1 methyltransferase domain-containing protein [Sulfurimicrobium sp.]
MTEKHEHMSTGSYNFETLNDSDFQAERLRQQAEAVRGMEIGILRSAGIQSGHDVLELGCGPGFVSDLLAELAPEGSLTVVEPSPILLAQVADNIRNKPARGLLRIQAYGDCLPIPEASMDFSYARFVLQHIPQPETVISEIHRTLRSGGRFCVVDSDDGLVVFYPEDPRVNQLLRTAQTTQAEKGGDRFIGRKLPNMMAKAGFVNINSRVLALTSSELPFNVLFNILLGYKASLLSDAIDIKQLFQDLSEQVASGCQLIAGGVFIITGEKS